MLRLDVMHIVGRDELNAEFTRKRRHSCEDIFLDLGIVILYLQIKIVPEKTLVHSCHIASLVVVVGDQMRRHHTVGARRKCYETRMVLCQEFKIYPGFVVKAFGVR